MTDEQDVGTSVVEVTPEIAPEAVEEVVEWEAVSAE